MGKPRTPFANRGPIEFTSLATPVTFPEPTPIGWILVVSAGSGAITVKDEAGTSRPLTGLVAGDVLTGPFTELTSMSLSKIRVGDGPPPVPAPSASNLASTTAGNGASTVGIADAGNFTAQTTVEGALQEVYQDLESTKAILPLRVTGGFLIAGTPLAAIGAAPTPGIDTATSGGKCAGVRWGAHATPTAFFCPSVTFPADFDATKAPVLKVLAGKVGATLGDAVTFLVTCYQQVVGAAFDGGANLGGTTGAMQGDATSKTVQQVSLTLTAAAAAPSTLAISMKPTNGTLGTDAVIIFEAWIEYTRKLRAS